jgi:chromosome segregation ATPase
VDADTGTANERIHGDCYAEIGQCNVSKRHHHEEINKLDAMDSTLEKINEKMQHMDTRVSSLEKDLHGTNVTMSELEKGVNFASKCIDGAKEASHKLEREVKELRNEIKHVHRDRERMHENILDVQVRFMQDTHFCFELMNRTMIIP